MRRVRKCVQRAAYAPACILLISPIYLALAWDLDTRDFFPPMWDSGGKQFLNAGGLPLGEPMNVSRTLTLTLTRIALSAPPLTPPNPRSSYPEEVTLMFSPTLAFSGMLARWDCKYEYASPF